MPYIGWIPTVTGHLSFSTIGDTSHPTKSISLRNGDRLLSYQRRDLLDVLIPYLDRSIVGRGIRELIANHVIGISGNFSFVMYGEYDRNPDLMSGEIFLISNALSSRNAKDIRRRFYNEFKAKDREETSFLQTREIVREASLLSASFSLSRSGIITMEFPENDNYIGEEDIRWLVANQMYFFIKDISHVHQHHNPRHDAIIDVCYCASPSSNDWISKTQSSLYRSVIRYKRFRNEKALFRASGILAYAKSFERIASKRSKGIRRFNNAELEQSLSVTRDEIKHFDQKKIAEIETTRNVFFTLFGIAISASYLSRLKADFETQPHESIVIFAQIVSEKPLHLIMVAFAISVLYSLLTHKKDPAEFVLIRSSFRMIQGFRIRNWYIFSILATVICSILSYFFVRAAF